MIAREREPTTPGKILQVHYLEPRKITMTEFAEVVGCSRKHISDIVHGRARIDAVMARRMAEVLDTTVQFWLNLQNATDIFHAKRRDKSWRPKKVFSAPVRERVHG